MDISIKKCTENYVVAKKTHIDRRSRYSRKVIKEALLELLSIKKLDEITVVDVCRKADVNRGTFYKYYRDVPDLYSEIEDGFINKIHTLFGDSTDTESNIFDFEKLLNIFVNDADFVYIAKNEPYSRRIVQKLLKDYIPYLHRIIEVRSHGNSKVKEEFLTQYILGGCSKTISWWVESGMQIPAKQINDLLVKEIQCSLKIFD